MATLAKTILLLSLLLSLSACSKEKIDLQEQINDQAELTLTLIDGTQLTSMLNAFCNETVCMDYGTPDTSSIHFSNYNKNTLLSFTVNSELEIESISAVMKNKNMSIVQNNIPVEFSQENQAYTMTPSFDETGEIVLSIKLKTTDRGYQTVLFFLDAK